MKLSSIFLILGGFFFGLFYILALTKYLGDLDLKDPIKLIQFTLEKEVLFLKAMFFFVLAYVRKISEKLEDK